MANQCPYNDALKTFLTTHFLTQSSGGATPYEAADQVAACKAAIAASQCTYAQQAFIANMVNAAYTQGWNDKLNLALGLGLGVVTQATNYTTSIIAALP